MQSIKIGSDPEGFLSLGGKFISAEGLFPGDKKNPFKIERGAVQVDGMAVEFNIDAADNEDDFERNMRVVMSQLDEMTAKIDKDIRINWIPFAEFEEDVWNGSSNESKILGCDPDWNISGEINPNPSDKIQNQRFRTAAGHVHIGWTSDRSTTDNSHFEDCLYIARFFQNHANKFFAPTTELERKRLEFYGMNGSFRPKSYGVELRGPSNIWVGSEKTRREMFNIVRHTVKLATGM